MLETRRHILDALRDGPALFVGLPGDEVDLDRLAAHLTERGIDAGVYATDGSLEGLLWIQQGAVGDTWFFEAGGQEAVLPVTTSRDLLLDIAARGGAISVHVGTQPGLASQLAAAQEPPLFMFSTRPSVTYETSVSVHDVAPAVREPVLSGDPAAHGTRFDGTVPAHGAPADVTVESGVPASVEPAPVDETTLPDVSLPADEASPGAVSMEPPSHPWPAILAEMAARVVRHRGPKLAAQFAAALGKTLADHGGRIDGDEIFAPPLPESTWRAIVEAGCAPIVAVAGRAFVDRTIAAAERAVLDTETHLGELP
jgi:hypothetical protein